MNQVRRGCGFWPVIAIPASSGGSVTLALQSSKNTFRAKGKDSINASSSTINKGKMQGDKGGN